MSLTPSLMLALGTKAPDFCLEDVCSHKLISLQNAKSDVATVILFICNHCPFVKFIQAKLLAVASHYQQLGINFIAISANDIDTYPEDSPAEMQKIALKYAYPFPYLYDATQSVARAYQAACTPDFYIFDKNLKCVYRGRFCDATPNNNKAVTGKDLIEALESILTNKPLNQNQYPSIGCNIKWKNN
jgi:peroxiredoxin